MIVDEMFHRSRYGCYELAQVHHIDLHVLRVRVRRDITVRHSDAVVEVLTTHRTWTVLADTPAPTWHPDTPQQATGAACLAPVADHLVERAHRILTVVTSPESR